MLILRVLFTKLSKMNKQNAFIESYAYGIRQERYISVNFKSVVLNGPYMYSQRQIKNHLRTPGFLLAYKVNGTSTKFCF